MKRLSDQEKMPRLGVAILQWNHFEHTESLLADLQSQIGPAIKMVVCDNGSGPGCWSALAEKITNLGFEKVDSNMDWTVSVVRNRNNSGFAAGMNVAIKQLLEAKCDWIWVLNNDVNVQDDMIERLLGCLQEKSPGFYGTMFRKQDDLKPGLVVYNKWLTSFKYVNENELDAALKMPDIYIDGASMIIHKNVFESVGLLSDRTFLYFEELDFSKRVKSATFDMGILTDVWIEHIGGGSSDNESSSTVRTTMYHETWSTLAINKAYYPFLFCLVSVVRMPIRILSLVLKARFIEISSVFMATLDFFRGYNKDKRPASVSEKYYFYRK